MARKDLTKPFLINHLVQSPDAVSQYKSAVLGLDVLSALDAQGGLLQTNLERVGVVALPENLFRKN